MRLLRWTVTFGMPRYVCSHTRVEQCANRCRSQTQLQGARRVAGILDCVIDWFKSRINLGRRVNQQLAAHNAALGAEIDARRASDSRINPELSMLRFQLAQDNTPLESRNSELRLKIAAGKAQSLASNDAHRPESTELKDQLQDRTVSHSSLKP